MPIPLLAEIERWITEHASAAVMKERMALVKDRLVLLEGEVAQLKAQNRQLHQQARDLQDRLARVAAAQEFAECRGALFKRTPGGGYVQAVYCPTCRIATAPWPPRTGEFSCNCGWQATFGPLELPAILAELTG